MPVKRRIAKQRILGLSEMVHRVLLDELTLRQAMNELEAAKGAEYDDKEMKALWELQWLSWPEVTGVPTLRQIWRLYGAQIVEEFVTMNPGTRPSAWWRYDAPRVSDDQLIAWRFQKELHPWFTAPHRHERPCEPRLRLGGTGTPCYEVLAHVPAFHLGLPHPWVQPWDADYYNGRAVNIHGQPIGTEFKEGRFKGVPVDPLDPPVFESEAAYLRRHSLFLPGEKSRLSADAFEPDTLGPEWWSESRKND